MAVLKRVIKNRGAIPQISKRNLKNPLTNLKKYDIIKSQRKEKEIIKMMTFKEKWNFLRKTLGMSVILSLYYALTYNMIVEE